MPISIEAAQQKYLSSGEYAGESPDSFKKLGVTENIFEQYAINFLQELGKSANKNKVVASGELLKNATFRISNNGKQLDILMSDYFDYPNEGVKGVKSSKNAPNSPYQFKSLYTMTPDGRRNLKKYIASGKAKVKTVLKSNDKALGIGLERKNLSLMDLQVNTLIYNIKKYGIKTTNYFNDAVKIAFKDIEITLSEAVGRDIILKLEKINRKK